jgi:2-(1,2-epoxy-1,2-dihydrophenyl)acetyl-CoA isomerase
MTTGTDEVRTSLDADGIFTIMIDRPEAMNGVNERVGRQLVAATQRAARDPGARTVIFTGAGKAFCAGGDFKSFGRPDLDDPLTAQWHDKPIWTESEARAERLMAGAEVTRLLHEMGKPTIAMIRGPAVGAGIGYLAACDFRFASETASFQSGYVRVGLSPDIGTTYFVTKLLGPSKAREFMFVNEKLDAQEALRIGLVGKVVADDRLEEETMAFARRLAKGPPVAIRNIKQGIVAAETETMREVMEMEARNMARCFQTADAKEAVRAFMEKRPAVFNGY